MIALTSFNARDFEDFISWIDNEALLITIAGNVFSYPLTAEQLQNYAALENSHSFTIVDTERNKKIGHAELAQSGKDLYKIDKLIIGDKANRGKGIGEKVINELLHFSFNSLHASVVELNVFDWNTAGIQCYTKCGFIINEDKTADFKVGDKSWTALNMTINRDDWSKRK